MNPICNYCYSKNNKSINGKPIRFNEFRNTSGYTEPKNYKDYLELFILKGDKDEKAGLMIENINGTRFIDINYCPFCGRKLNER